MELTATPLSSPRSTFVTALAWVFIVLAGFATLIAIMQNLMVTLMFPVAEMQAAADQAQHDERIPWFAAFMLQNIRFVFLAFLVLSAGTLASAIGLLKRRNWARLAFVGLMAFGVLWNIAGGVLTIAFFSSIPPVPPSATGQATDFASMMTIMIAFNLAFAVALSVLFGWIIKRLTSDEIRREFSAVAFGA